MARLLNLVRMTVSGAPGTGTVTLGAALAGYISFASAGAINGQTYTYAIREGNLREVCHGVYTSSGTTLSRVTLRSTNATPTNPESFTSAAIVAAVAAGEDWNDIIGNTTITGTATVTGNVTAPSATFNTTGGVPILISGPVGTALLRASGGGGLYYVDVGIGDGVASVVNWRSTSSFIVGISYDITNGGYQVNLLGGYFRQTANGDMFHDISFGGSNGAWIWRQGASALERARVDKNGSFAYGVGGDAHASAIHQVDSTTKGALIPRMTTTQRDAIASPAEGLEVGNTTTHSRDFYNGTAWRQIDAEGTFTPTIVSTGGGVPTYSVQTGFYTVIGNRVFFNLRIVITAVNTLAAGTITIGGLPFTSNNTANNTSSVSVHSNNLTAASTALQATISPNSTVIVPSAWSAGTANQLSVANLTATTVFNIAGHYPI